MKKKHKIHLPEGICANLSEDDFETLTKVAYGLEPLWENALGKNWKNIMTPERLKALYQRM